MKKKSATIPPILYGQMAIPLKSFETTRWQSTFPSMHFMPLFSPSEWTLPLYSTIHVELSRSMWIPQKTAHARSTTKLELRQNDDAFLNVLCTHSARLSETSSDVSFFFNQRVIEDLFPEVISAKGFAAHMTGTGISREKVVDTVPEQVKMQSKTSRLREKTSVFLLAERMTTLVDHHYQVLVGILVGLAFSTLPHVGNYAENSPKKTRHFATQSN